MRIRCLHVRRFRSIESATLAQCGSLNVLIGKNNAGKSNLLATIDLVFGHLSRGNIAGPWSANRPIDEFTDRDIARPLQLGVVLDLPESLNAHLRERLLAEAPQLERSIDQIKDHDQIAFVLAGACKGPDFFLFVQHAAIGSVQSEGDELAVDGIRLLAVPTPVAHELFLIQQDASDLRRDISALEELATRPSRIQYLFEEEGRTVRNPRVMERMLGLRLSTALHASISKLFTSAANLEEFTAGVSQLIGETRSNLDELGQRRTTAPMSTFAGEARTAPAYANWLISQYGKIGILHLRERKQPIGRDEAGALLQLKVKRGGPERLRVVQDTVRALLGVTVDAFEAESRADQRAAEMDVDDFLVEANGAGIREALRIMLDLELKGPELLLIEEPEVHLHPGLERAVESYLREKSRDVQMFLTTHSTNFVDAVSFQNVYLVSRNSRSKTDCQAVDAGSGAASIPTELGLRLSTVFMYDRLVFVEGPSDEAVLRELATKSGIEFSKANVGFVSMGGVRNFAYYAAQATLDLLARRRVRIWFVADRDERDDAEVEKMLATLGDRATLCVLRQRELENYLTNAGAVASFVVEKQRLAGILQAMPSEDEIQRALQEAAGALKEEVLRLRLERRLLTPLILQGRTVTGSLEERLQAAKQDVELRRDKVNIERERLTKELDASWPTEALKLAPGTMLLDKVASKYSVRFHKEAGDSLRLARFIPATAIAAELADLLRNVAREAD